MTGGSTPSWSARLNDRLAASAPQSAPWRKADANTIRQVLTGVSPYSGSVKPEAGARVVFNIASVHIPGFASSGPAGGYKNRYAVAAAGRRVGESAPPTNDVRTRIDDMLGWMLGTTPDNIHYGAVELNGAGVRYYGDFCLVLKTDAVEADTPLLDRNSFDLICEPLRASTHPTPKGTWDGAAARAEAYKLAGSWSVSLAELAACKILDGRSNASRRITIGAISEGVLSDEDYIEVIRIGSFTSADVAEARTTAADAAAEAWIGDRVQAGPTPDWASLLWRHRRRRAEARLSDAGIPVRVVIGAGRVRS